MKKIIVLSAVLSIFVYATPLYAQTATPKEDATVSEKLDKQINELKEKIASRVSELDLVEKRGIIGTVQDAKGSQITLTDLTGETRFVDVDEITKFSSAGSSGTFGISDLTKGTQISVLGTYNKQSKRILARFVKTHIVPTRLSGTITAIDAKNYQITMLTEDKKEVKLDIDTATDTYSYTKEAGLKAYGFSKLESNNRIMVIGTPDKKDPQLISTERLIDFVNLPNDPALSITQPTQEPESTIAPTGTGGKKINPIQ